MEDIFNHLWDWIILIGLIAGAFYGMQMIKQEAKSFKEDCYEVQFENLNFLIPSWWSITEQTDHSLKFERTDTRYDWYARFTWFANEDERKLIDIFDEKLGQEDLDYDKDDVVIETDSRVLFRNSKIQEHFQEVIRVEGKATQAVIERVYFDLYLMRGLNQKGYFICESRSSVLNGMVEGPFFEESMSELNFSSERNL